MDDESGILEAGVPVDKVTSAKCLGVTVELKQLQTDSVE